MDITISDAQLKALRKLDPVKTARQVVQIHVDTWLAPHVAQLGEDDTRDIARAYDRAATDVQLRVKAALGIG